MPRVTRMSPLGRAMEFGSGVFSSEKVNGYL
jgi:hypothetical protein